MEIDAADRAAWGAAPDPGALFVALWKTAAAWAPADRDVALALGPHVRTPLKTALASDAGADAVAQVMAIFDKEWPAGTSAEERRLTGGLVLEAMRAIDEAFTPCHPRTRMLSSTISGEADLPAWLDAANIRRLTDDGVFAATAERRLIPSGPFSRHARGRDASAANSLQDQFPILTVAPAVATHEDRDIAVGMKVVGTDVMGGLPAAPSIGRERIRFIPLAEGKDDLVLTPGERNARPVLDVRPAIDLAARLIDALGGSADLDIAFAPELTVPGADEHRIADAMTMLGDAAPRIVLAGSGLTRDVDGLGRAWNEARIYARGGTLLWKQRKIWPYGMSQQAACSYGLPDPGPGQNLMEDVAGHGVLEMVDLDGFGRCLVLICQDLQSQPVVNDLIRRYQPDWVLAPILDPGVKASGWAHQRTLELSHSAQARFLVGSSLTLSLHLIDVPASEPGVGLCVGPYEPSKNANGELVATRALACVSADPGVPPRSGTIKWDHRAPVWTKSNVGAASAHIPAAPPPPPAKRPARSARAKAPAPSPPKHKPGT